MQRTKRVISLVLSLMLVVSCFTCLASVRVFADKDTNNSATFLYGDVDGDGKVRTNDATAIQRHLAMVQQITGKSLREADYNHSNKIDIDDATSVQRFIAGIK